MDRGLVKNWNFTVRSGDVVIFPGICKHSRQAKDPHYYLDVLNGNTEFIKGNHDDETRIHGMLGCTDSSTGI